MTECLRAAGTLKESARRWKAVADVVRLGRTATGEADLLRRALDLVLELLALDAGSIRTFDETTGRFFLRALRNLPDERRRFLDHLGSPDPLLVEAVLSMKRPAVIDAGSPMGARATRWGFPFFVAVPFRCGDAFLGFFELGARSSREPAEEDLLFLETLGLELGGAVARFRAEAALRRSESRYRAIIDSADKPFLIADGEGRITDCNEAYLLLCGYRREEVLGRLLVEIVPEVERALLSRQWRRGKEIGSCDYEIGLLRSDGEVVPIRVQASALAGWGGERFHFAFLTDLRERYRREEQDRRHLAFFKTLLDTIPCPVFYEDGRGIYRGCNRAFLDLFGFDEASFIGRRAEDLFPPAMAEAIARSDRELLRRQGTKVYELCWSFDGQRRHFVVSKASYADGEGCVGALLEITEHKKMEEALREARDEARAASEAKTVFLAQMSHEIRTPMNAVVGFAELLADTELDGEQRLLLSDLLQGARSLADIVGDLLDLARIESGRIELGSVPFVPEEICRQVCLLLSLEARRKGIDLSFDDGGFGETRLLGDAFRLRQVLWNLVGNAVKFTERGGVVLSIRRHRDGGKVRVDFRVADTGIGVAAESIGSIFDDFVRCASSRSPRGPGLGLGLAIARRIVRAMGGEISVTSREREGSTFAFSLVFPVAESKEEEGSLSREVPRDLKVLLAEDDVLNVKLMTILFKRLDWAVVVAGDGREALAAFERERFDIVFMDLQMPRMDGFEALALLRERERGRERTPVIALTAYALSGDRKRCLEAGMDDYLPKPLTIEALKSAVGRVLNGAAKRGGLFDVSHLRAMTGDEALMAEAAELFLERLPRLRATLQESLPGDSVEAIGRSFHGLRSSLSYFAGEELRGRLLHVEGILRRQDLDGAKRELAALDPLLDRLVSEVRCFFALH